MLISSEYSCCIMDAENSHFFKVVPLGSSKSVNRSTWYIVLRRKKILRRKNIKEKKKLLRRKIFFY
jgi:hypothetical protein